MSRRATPMKGQAGAQATAVQPLNATQSQLMIRNLLRIATYNITYLRGLFPDEHYAELNTLGMSLKKLTPSCENSERMIKWLEKGVFDALEHKYLRTMMLGLCDSENPSVLLEAYEFHFRYISAEDNGGVDAIAMEFDNKTFSTKNAASSKAPSQEQARKLATKMIRMLCELMKTFDDVPDERYLTMRLTYQKHTPEDYEPPHFTSSTGEQPVAFSGDPFSMRVGEVQTKSHSMYLRVRTNLDSCEAEDCGFTEEKQTKDAVAMQISPISAKPLPKPRAPASATPPHRVAPQDRFSADCRALQTEPQDAPMSVEEETYVEETCMPDSALQANNMHLIRHWLAQHYRRDDMVVEIVDLMSEFTSIDVKELEAVVDQLVLDGVLERTSNEEHFTVRRKGIAAAAPPPPPLTKAKAAIMPSPPKAIARPASPRPLPSEKERLKLLKRVLLAVPKVKDGKVGVSTLAKITHKSSAEVDEMVHILLENGCLPVEHTSANPKAKAGSSLRLPLYDADAVAVKALLHRVDQALVESSVEEWSLQGDGLEDNMASAPAATVSPGRNSSAAAKAHAPASAAKGAKGRRQAPLPIASESDAPATIVAPATVSAPTSSVIQHNARTAAAAPTTSAASVLQAPPPAARAADSNKGGWKKRTKPELAPQRITPQKSQPPTPAMAAPHVEETMEPEPESQGTQEMWSEGVTCKRARKVSVVRSPIRQSAPMVKRARSRHSTPVSARKADSCMHGSQAAATSRCG